MPNLFFHDLQCRSGFGDRLLDLWAARTVATLHAPETVLTVHWHQGRAFVSFIGDYGTEGFRVAGCRFTEIAPQGAYVPPDSFSHVALNDRGLVQLPGGITQLILRRGMIWGNSPPDRLHTDLPFYSLDATIPLERIIATYRDVAVRTLPAPGIRAAAPAGVDGCVGVHIRLGDKLVPAETAVDMSMTTWRALEQQTVAFVESCIARGCPVFVCSDDEAYKAAFIGHLRQRRAAVVASDPGRAPRHLAGASALVDFFALSRCSLIVQMTKYSTFSLAAALCGRVPLVNFFCDSMGTGHRLDIWRRTLAAASFTQSGAVDSVPR